MPWRNYRATAAFSLMHLDLELRALDILKKADIDVGIAGKDESCCGGRAYELGFVDEFTKFAPTHMETLQKAGELEMLYMTTLTPTRKTKLTLSKMMIPFLCFLIPSV